jgi:hypothetical protein
MRYVQRSSNLHEGADALAGRCVEMAQALLAGTCPEIPMARGGRKGNELDTHAQLHAKP